MTDLSTALREATPKSWLALSHDENAVVGNGKSIQDAVEKANENGEPDPVLIWIPEAWAPAVYIPRYP